MCSRQNFSKNCMHRCKPGAILNLYNVIQGQYHYKPRSAKQQQQSTVIIGILPIVSALILEKSNKSLGLSGRRVFQLISFLREGRKVQYYTCPLLNVICQFLSFSQDKHIDGRGGQNCCTSPHTGCCLNIHINV